MLISLTMKTNLKLKILLCTILSSAVFFFVSGFFSSRKCSFKCMDQNKILRDIGEKLQQTGESLETEKTPKATENGQIIQVDSTGKPQQAFAKRKNLILLSTGRGGSSFLGSLFYNNPRVMYWFEPLRTIERLVFDEKVPIKYEETCIEVLDKFYQCNFSSISDTILSAFFTKLIRKDGNTISNEHFPQFSKTLISKACNNYSHTVTKILNERVPYKTIEALKDIFQQQNQYDVKLVHLVRDPRAVIYSRVKLKWMGDHLDPSFRENVQSSICDPVLQNVRLGLFSPPLWLKNRFKVVRYEDLVANTANLTRELYSFAGFDWSASIDKWISILANNSEHSADAFSLYRNPSVAMNEWRNAPEPFIRAVEDVCSDLMDLLGYKKNDIIRKI